MIDVTVKVPEDRVGEFYAMFGKWLNGSTPPPLGPLSARVAEAAEGRRAWSSSDGELAAVVWDKLSDTAKALFSILIDEPETRFSGDELSAMLNIPNGKHGVAGVFAWPGRHSFGVNRQWPWKWGYPRDSEAVEYWFDQETAALFREARDNAA